MGFFAKKREEKEKRKEEENFAKTLGFENEGLSAKEKQKRFSDDLERKNKISQALKNTFNRLLNENKISENDYDAFSDIMETFKYQRDVSDPHATQLIDYSIIKTLKFIEKMSDEFGGIAARNYITRLRTLISQREDPTPQYKNAKYLEMEHNLFQIQVTYDALNNALDHIKADGAKYKQEYLKYKEKGDKVRADRVLIELKRLKDELDTQQRQLDSLAKKETLAREMRTVFGEQANNIGLVFEDPDLDLLNEVCQDNIVEDKKMNQALGIVNKYKDKLKTQNTNLSVSDNDFETNKSSSSISQAEEEDILSGF